jgi:hypothetical protein
MAVSNTIRGNAFTPNPLVDNTFGLLLAVKPLFAGQKNSTPKNPLEPVQTRDLMPCSPSKNGS